MRLRPGAIAARRSLASRRVLGSTSAAVLLVLALAPATTPASAQLVSVRAADASQPDPSLLDEIGREGHRGVLRVLEFLGEWAPPDSTVALHVYGSSMSKSEITGDDRPLHRGTAPDALHAVVSAQVRGDRLGGEARILVERAVGPPRTPVLAEGLDVFFSEEWGGHGFEYWGARLHRAGLVPPLERILDPAWMDEASPFVTEPIAGLLAGHLIGRWSRRGFLERYGVWAPDAEEILTLEPGWLAFLERVAREHDEAIGLHRTRARREAADLSVPLRGVNYAHEGYRSFDGYLSHRSDASLAYLAGLGASAVAVLPYSFLSSPDRPGPLRIPTRAGSETDAAVTHAIRTASELGMSVLLKPHIWVRGSWPGEIEMAAREDWDRFFAEYERWILHYALMAEIEAVPILSLGVEMSAATLQHEARWRTLVERVRSVYSGALVYAANWGEEFENLGFWHVFDYLGVDAYYPLSSDPNATDAELRAGARRMLERVESVHRRFGKPVLFTEIGFASTESPWIRPWESHLVEQTNPTHQLRSYRAVLAEMEGRDWIAGVFWWEWPSDMRGAERDVRGYMPVGKSVESALSDWFRQGPLPTTDADRSPSDAEANRPTDATCGE